jgi:small subunit ribosomal protein S4
MLKLKPRHRICRRVGAPLCGRQNCPVLRRRYPPGQHGGRWISRPKEYQVRLLEKQKIRAVYGIPERQMRRYHDRAARRKRATGEELLLELETRLDSLVHRLGFAISIRQARKLVSHGHVRLNGRRVDIPSAAVRPGQTIGLTEEAARALAVREAIEQSNEIPPYLARDADRGEGKLLRMPEREEIPLPVPIDERLIVEHYARVR